MKVYIFKYLRQKNQVIQFVYKATRRTQLNHLFWISVAAAMYIR